VLPDVIDEESRRRGNPIRSCKVARTAMKGYEIKRELDILLDKPWPKLKLVMIDITLGSDNRFNVKNDYTPRVLRWHTWEFLPWYLEHLDGERIKNQNPIRAYSSRLLRHFKHFAVNQLLVGRGAEHLATLSEAPPKERWVYKPPTSEEKIRKRRRTNDKRVRELRKQIQVPSQRDAKLRGEWFLELRDLTRSHGVEADALFAPVWRYHPLSKNVFPKNDPPVVHDYADPEKYPILYKFGAHTGSEHLSHSGSHDYSTLLGRDLAERVTELAEQERQAQ
jgi:hypothetical protein